MEGLSLKQEQRDRVKKYFNTTYVYQNTRSRGTAKIQWHQSEFDPDTHKESELRLNDLTLKCAKKGIMMQSFYSVDRFMGVEPAAKKVKNVPQKLMVDNTSNQLSLDPILIQQYRAQLEAQLQFDRPVWVPQRYVVPPIISTSVHNPPSCADNLEKVTHSDSDSDSESDTQSESGLSYDETPTLSSEEAHEMDVETYNVLAGM